MSVRDRVRASMVLSIGHGNVIRAAAGRGTLTVRGRVRASMALGMSHGTRAAAAVVL